MDDTVNGERREPLAPSKQTIFSCDFVIASRLCNKERAGEGWDAQTPYSSCGLIFFWKKGIAGLATIMFRAILHVTFLLVQMWITALAWPRLTPARLSSALPRPNLNHVPPPFLKECTKWVLRAPTDLPTPPELSHPARVPMSAPAPAMGFLHPESEPKTPFNDVKPGVVLQAKVGWRAQQHSLPIPGRLVM